MMKKTGKTGLCCLVALALLLAGAPCGRALESRWGKDMRQSHIASTVAAQKKVMDKVSEIVSTYVKSGMSDYEKALVLHDYLVDTTQYDSSLTEHNAEGVLLKETGVCQSYAAAYSLLLDKAGVWNDYALSSIHIWNLVQMNGAWYHIDVTWDSPREDDRPEDEGIRHLFFGVPDEVIYTLDDHDRKRSAYQATAYELDYLYSSGRLDPLLNSMVKKIQAQLDAGKLPGSVEVTFLDKIMWEGFDENPTYLTGVDKYQMMERTAAIVLRNHVFTYKGMEVLLNVAFDGKRA